jgi:hypothetical protein
MKKMTTMKDGRCAEFQNEVNSVKKIIKAEEKRHAQLQNQMESTRKTIEVKDECCAHSQNAEGGRQTPCLLPDRGGFKEEGDEEIVFGAYRTDGRRSSIHGVPRRDEGIQKAYTVASKVTTE